MNKVYYIYESHMGGWYVTEEELPYEDCYCEECGDSDILLYSGTVYDILEELSVQKAEAHEKLMNAFEVLKGKDVPTLEMQRMLDGVNRIIG